MLKVLITGSGRRIGRGLAIEFAKKGYDVAVHYNESEISAKETFNLIKNLNVNSILLKADLTKTTDIDNMFLELISKFGVPDILVNNAGVFPKKTAINNLQINQWHNTLDINLNTVFYTSKKFAEIAKENSKIINIASIGALEIWEGRIPYNVSKSALITLTQALARELAPYITVNAVSPGTVYIEGEPAEEKLLDVNKIPAKRYGTIDDIFSAVYFFATSGNYITGNNLIVDGAARFI